MEKKGYIKEYTVMPDFVKLGYSIVALTFSKLRKLNLEELEKAHAITREFNQPAKAPHSLEMTLTLSSEQDSCQLSGVN